MNAILGPNAKLTSDRFGNPNSALLLDHSYATIPGGMYFDPETGGFTIMAWIRGLSMQSFQRIFEISNGANKDNVALLFDSMSLNLELLSESYFSFQTPVTIGVWTHVCVSVTGTNAKHYINGILATQVSGRCSLNIFPIPTEK